MSKAGGIFKYGYGVLNDLGMFSPTAKTLDMLGDVKGKPEQLLGQIKNIGGKAVEEEAMFTGLDQFVETMPDKTISTQELKDFLVKNPTQIKQEVQGTNVKVTTEDVSRFQDANRIIDDWEAFEKAPEFNNSKVYNDEQFKIELIKPHELDNYSRDTRDFEYLPEGQPYVDWDPDAIYGTDEYFRITDKKSGHVTTGNNQDGWIIFEDINVATDNYNIDDYEEGGAILGNVGNLNEVDITTNRFASGDRFNPTFGSYDTEPQYFSQTIGGGKLNSNYREVRLINESPFQMKKDDYVTEHYPDKNLIVHTRQNDKITEDGKKTLFLEELQSDWSQRGEEGKLLNYTTSEKKSLINSRKPQMIKNLKGNYDKLSKISNIDDIKVYHQFDPVDSNLVDNNKRIMSYSYLNDDLDSQISKLNLKSYISKDKEGIQKQINLLNDLKTNDYSLGNLINKSGTKYKFLETFPEKKLDDVQFNFDGDYNDHLFPRRVNEELINPLQKKIFHDLMRKVGKADDDVTGFRFINKMPDEDVKKLSKLYFGNNKEKITKYFKEYQYTFKNSTPNIDKIDIDTQKKVLQNIFLNSEKSIEDLVPKHRKIIENFDVTSDNLEEGYKLLKNIDSGLEENYNFERKLLGTHDIPSGPFVGDTSAYTEIGFKNILKNAIDEGYEKISISPGYVHLKRSGVPRLVRYYDNDVPKSINKIIKGTDAVLQKERVFHNDIARKDFIEEFTKFGGNDPDSDTAKAFDLANNQNEANLRNFFMDSYTLTITPKLKELVKSGQSLYTPALATGLAGATANKMLGSEEDIITEDSGI